jgi:8-oxo-dGTP pyrophosphatase MutT (NUDIX family)
MDGALIVVKNRFGAGRWQLAGGGIGRSESVEQAARRELYEELGVYAEKITTISELIIVRQFGLLMRYQFVYVHIPKQKLVCGSDISDFTIYRDDLACAKEVYEGIRLLKKQHKMVQ